MRAVYNDTVIAESKDTIVVENNHYFPADSVSQQFLKSSETTTVCGWKGTANYYSVVVGDSVNKDAAWYYAEPKSAAAETKDYVAFWRGVQVVE